MNAKESLLNSLTEERRAETLSLASMFSLTEQMELELVKNQADLMLFDMPSLADLINLNEILILDNGQRRNAFLSMMRKTMMEIEKSEIDYSSFPTYRAERGEISVIDEDSQLGFGRCPCPIDGEKTRCCKLTTLDVITQCAFSCSYCSVQAFYDRMRIKAVSNLREKLDALHIDDSVWHIGTGQASDSLFLGDDHGILSDLAYFSEKHPNIMIELKSKAYRTDIFKRKYPRNMVFTWSLNAPTVIEKEERGTASLIKRLECAAAARDNGSLVGFHIHPMVYFKGWDEEYPRVAEEIERRFSPDDIYAISIGTLTFTKAVLKKLRQRGAESRVLVERSARDLRMVRERAYENPERRVYGSLFLVDGPSASPAQFYLTDSARHFFRGALYFDQAARPDSLRPVVDYLLNDLVELIETFNWK